MLGGQKSAKVELREASKKPSGWDSIAQLNRLDKSLKASRSSGLDRHLSYSKTPFGAWTIDGAWTLEPPEWEDRPGLVLGPDRGPSGKLRSPLQLVPVAHIMMTS
eukprot:8297264-Karenia_brevis.AAC.1